MSLSNSREDRSEPMKRRGLLAPVFALAPREQPVDPLPPGGEFHFRRLMVILRQRLGLILTMGLFGTALACAAALSMQPKYTAKAQILVDSQQPGAANGQATGAAADEPMIGTHVAALASHEHLRRVIESLARNPHDGSAIDQVERRAAQACEEQRARPGTGERPECVGPAGAKLPSLGDFERYLGVSQERASRVISVRFAATNRVWAATVANRVVRLYIDEQAEQKRQSVAAELARVAQRISNVKVEGEQTAAELAKLVQQSLNAQQGSVERNAIDNQLRQLQRGSAPRDQLYASLLQRQRELRYQQEFVVPDLRVLSAAEPPNHPSSPSALLLILPAFFLSLMAGCLLAVIIDRLDQGIRSGRQVAEALGISTLAMTPLLSRAGRIRMHRNLAKKPFDTYTEAIRSLVAGLQLVSPQQRSKIILMSSSLPQEGRTTLAVSVAMYLAQLRKRVLLVDLDFRRGSVARVLNMKAKKGITDILLHDIPAHDVIQRTPYFGLDFLPMSRYKVDPMYLFTGSQLSRLLNQLRDNYDCLIVDGPPVLRATEARLLATLADQLVFVVKWGSTPRDVALNAINQLRRTGYSGNDPHNWLRAVVSQVNPRKHARYKYRDVGAYFSPHGSYYSSTPRYRKDSTSVPQLSVVSGGEPSQPDVKGTQT
jgi:polysaccharide biosynthesis transport protein